MTDNTKGIGMGFEDPAPPYTTNPQPQFIYPQNGQQVPQQISTVFNAQASTPQIVQVVHIDQLRAQPVRMKCPRCGADIDTRIKFEPGRMTHLAALVFCAIGCWLCCCIPYCLESCHDVQHECPACDHYIGNFRR